MSIRRWLGALWQRMALFLLAGVTAVFVLHVQAGLTPPKPDEPVASFSSARWAEAARSYLGDLVRGELGTLKALKVTGYTRDLPMAQVLAEHGPNSGLLLLLSLLTSLFFGTLAGLLSSQFGLRWFRLPALSLTLLFLSTPDILIILFLRALVAWVLSAAGIQLLSLSSLGADLAASHFIAPVLALSALPLALVARISAVAFDEVYDQLYIRTAVAKGLHPLDVIFRHALKNAWIRVAESGPLIMSALVTGLVIVEYVLYFPGIGRTLGVILERAVDPRQGLGLAQSLPVASSSIALMLLLGAVLIDLAFAGLRLALDPRLAEAPAQRPTGLRGGWAEGLLALPAAIVALPRALREALADLPHRLGQALWLWRPSHLAREIWRNPPLLIGLLGLLGLAFVALFGGQFVDLSTAHRAPRYLIHQEEVFFPPFGPGLPGYPLGSDMAGRNVLTRLLIGARYTLFFTLAVTPVRLVIALPWGLLAGLRGGLAAGMGRTLGLMLSALPVILIPAALLPLQQALGLDPGSGAGFWLIAAILAVVGVPRLVESIRQNVEAIAVQPYVEGARAVGAGTGRILIRHIFPHLVPQLWVTAAADMAWTLLLLAQFGVFSIYLGGAVFAATGYEILTDSSGVLLPRVPDWSSMLSRPYEVIYRAPWALWFPALAFLLAIVAFNLLAEGLRRRVQRIAAAPAAEPDERTGPARRRLALEWGVALALLLAATGLTARYGFQSSPLYATVKTQSALDQKRLQVQAVIETIQGTGSNLERSKAVAVLPRAGADYLREAHRAGLTSGEIQADSQGRFTMVDIEGYRLGALYVEGAPGGNRAFLFTQDKRTGEVAFAASVERPTSFAVLPAEPDRQGRPTFVLLVAGTVPGPDHWVLTAWTGPYRGFAATTWMSGRGVVGALHRRLPADLKARLVVDDGQGAARIEQTLGPLANIKVAPTGDVTFCRQLNRDCETVSWAELGW